MDSARAATTINESGDFKARHSPLPERGFLFFLGLQKESPKFVVPSQLAAGRRSEEYLFDQNAGTERDSSAKNAPRNDKNRFFPRPVLPTTRCNSRTRSARST